MVKKNMKDKAVKHYLHYIYVYTYYTESGVYNTN